MQQALHENPAYGVASVGYAPMVAQVIEQFGVNEMLIGNVLDDLQRVTAGAGVFTVHTGPAIEVLPDGGRLNSGCPSSCAASTS